MRILHIESPNPGKEGDHVYRTRQPCRALGELADVEIASGSFLSPAVHAAIPHADVLVLCDAVDPDLLGVIEARRRSGQLSVYEINDHVLAPQPWSATAYLARNPLLRSLSLQMAARSHAVQFNVPALAHEFAFLNPVHAIFENQLWDVPPLRPRLARGKHPAQSADTPLWLGWGGSLGHLEDLKWVMPALRAALDRHPQLGLSIMGPAALQPLFADLPPARFRFTPGGSLEHYYDFLADLDLGICPLLPTDFNRCRSDVKYLELASRGVPALCSDLPPYARSVVPGQTGFRFSDLASLGAHIDALVASFPLRAQVARAAHEDVSKNRRERAHASHRHHQYQRWRDQFCASAGALMPEGTAASAPAPEPRFAGSKYRVLSGGTLEDMLREGLRLAVTGQTADACAAFRHAQRLAPTFYLPSLYLGAMNPDPDAALAALDAARALAPHAGSVELQRGLRLEALDRSEEARAAFLRCQALLPTLGAATAQLGALAEKAGRLDESAAHYQEALAANPHYAPPALCLVQRALAAGDRDKAVTLLETALQHDPKLSRLHFLLARAQGDTGAWPAAQVHLARALATAEPVERAPILALLAKSQLARGDQAAAATTLAELRTLVSPGPVR